MSHKDPIFRLILTSAAASEAAERRKHQRVLVENEARHSHWPVWSVRDPDDRMPVAGKLKRFTEGNVLGVMDNFQTATESHSLHGPQIRRQLF